MKKSIKMMLLITAMFSLISCNVVEGFEVAQKIIDVVQQILPIIGGVIAGIIGDEAVRKIKNKKKE